VRGVVPLCAVEGDTHLGVVLAGPSLMERRVPMPPSPDAGDDPLEDHDWTGELSYRPCVSDDPQRELWEFFQYDDPDGRGAGRVLSRVAGGPRELRPVVHISEVSRPASLMLGMVDVDGRWGRATTGVEDASVGGDGCAVAARLGLWRR
jgi:hypothetical protein